MNKQYYQAIADLEKQGIAREYILGWASGFLGSPQVEEQRLSEAYAAGYEDGIKQHIEHALNWKTSG